MANKYEAREPDAKSAVCPIRAWHDPVLCGPGPGRPDTNKQIGLGQETRHGGLARHDPFTYKPAFLH
jgi:hypothetical protein